MLVASSNVATTCDKPNLEMERTFWSPGRPLTASSTGIVTCCSASWGLSAGTLVLICTWTGVVSGNASIGSRLNERPPMTISAAASTQTSSRFFNEILMSQFNMGDSFRASAWPAESIGTTRAHARAEPLGLQRKAVVHHDDFLRFQTGHHFELSVELDAKGH